MKNSEDIIIAINHFCNRNNEEYPQTLLEMKRLTQRIVNVGLLFIKDRDKFLDESISNMD